LRNRVGGELVVAVIEPRSHTMSLGTLHDELSRCTAPADRAFWFRGPNIKWDLGQMVHASVIPASVEDDLDRLVAALAKLADGTQRCHIVLMSNGAFGGIQQKLVQALDGAAAGSV
jgi:UDP-N-acetylmuramate: L-alanyl-gamma-D-glutamyl-meso-diaminopimelate ligase